MRGFRELDRKGLAGLFVTLSVCVALISLPATATAASSGTYFDHIIIIAMENQDYGSVIGCGSCAPFINSLAAAGSTLSNYQAYAQNINGCSAGCYEAFTAGQQTFSDSWCHKASSPCLTMTNIADQLQNAGLSSAMFCEDDCPRGADHFPFLGYTSTWNVCLKSNNCSGQTGPDGNLVYNPADALGSSTTYSSPQSNAGDSSFINYLNSASPANYIWLTPTDSHNMHDNSVTTGDNYLASLLCGCGAGGSIASPNAGTVFSTSLWKSGRTMLYLWWDENSNPPNVEYGPMVKAGYTSGTMYDEYNALHTIEANWGLPFITSVVSSASTISDIFTTSAPPGALSSSFSYSPSTPRPNQTVTFTASATGGTPPYGYSWSFGDGSSATGASATHIFSKASTYSVMLNVTDSNGSTSSSTQQVTASSSSNPGSTSFPLSTLNFLIIGLFVGGAASVSLYLAKYHSRNRKISAMLKDARQSHSRPSSDS